jgi:hypothetical protein
VSWEATPVLDEANVSIKSENAVHVVVVGFVPPPSLAFFIYRSWKPNRGILALLKLLAAIMLGLGCWVAFYFILPHFMPD